MAKRSENRDKAYELWLNHKGDISLKDIAARLSVSDSLVRKWKSLDQWSLADRDIGNGNVTVKDGNVTKAIGAPYGNRNGVGHGPPKGSRNAAGHHRPDGYRGNHNGIKHGLYAKFLPAETLEIAEKVADMTPIDMLWGSICMKYAAIIRAQRIMYVVDAEDSTRRVIAAGDTVSSFSYQEAWDKQATFLQAQAKAMKALSDMIKQYDELCQSEAATEEQRLRIDKLRIEVDAMKNSQGNDDGVKIIDDLEVSDDGDTAE